MQLSVERLKQKQIMNSNPVMHFRTQSKTVFSRNNFLKITKEPSDLIGHQQYGFHKKHMTMKYKVIYYFNWKSNVLCKKKNRKKKEKNRFCLQKYKKKTGK